MEYRHEAQVRANSWYIRLYLWAWVADLKSIDFCRLFWGYAFMIPNLLVRLIILPFWLLFLGGRWLVVNSVKPGVWVLNRFADVLEAIFGAVAWIAHRIPERKTVAAAMPIHKSILPSFPKKSFASLPKRSFAFSNIPPPPKKAKPSAAQRRQRRQERSERFLTSVGTTADKAVELCQKTAPYVSWMRYVFLTFFYAAGAVVALGCTALFCYGVYIAVVNVPMIAGGVWTGIAAAGNAIGVAVAWVVHGAWWLKAFIGLAIVGSIALISMIGGIFWMKNETEVFEKVGDGVGGAALGFGGAMRKGAMGVKSRTCPKIVVIDERQTKGGS